MLACSSTLSQEIQVAQSKSALYNACCILKPLTLHELSKQVCNIYAAATQGYGLESYDGLEDPAGSGDYLNTAELADGFQTSDSSAAGMPLDDEEAEFGDGMTNEQYGKARQLEKMSQQMQAGQLAVACPFVCTCSSLLLLSQKRCLKHHASNVANCVANHSPTYNMLYRTDILSTNVDVSECLQIFDSVFSALHMAVVAGKRMIL